MRYRVNERCIGCGLCASVCPAIFSMTDEGVATASPAIPTDPEAAQDAMNGCPVAAIEAEA